MVLSLLSQAVPVGSYVSWWKPIPVIIIVLLWGRLVTWIDKDAQEVLLPRVPLNIGNLVVFIIGLFLFFMLPAYAASLLVPTAVVAVEAGVYLGGGEATGGVGGRAGEGCG